MTDTSGTSAAEANRRLSSIVKGSSVGLILPMVGIVKSIVLIPILLQTLGEHEYGIYVLIATGISYTLILSGFGIDAAIYRYLPAGLRDNRERVLVSTALALAVLSGGGVFVVCALYALAAPAPVDIGNLPLLVGGIAFMQALWAVVFAYERTRERLLWLISATVIFNILELATYITTAYLWRDVNIMFAGILVLNAAWAAIWLTRMQLGLRFGRPALEPLKRMAAFGGHAALNTLVIGAFLTADKFWLGYFSGPATLAYYAPAFGIAQVLGSFASISLMSMPHLLALAHDKKQAADEKMILGNGVTVFLLLALPALLGLAIVSEPILGLLIGPELAVQAVPIAIIFAVSMFVSGIQRFAVQHLRVHGLAPWINLVTLTALAAYFLLLAITTFLDLNLSLAIPLIYLAIVLVQTTIFWARVRSLIGRVIGLQNLVAPVVLTLIAVGPGLLLDVTALPVLIAYILGAIAIYFGLLFIWWKRNPARFGYVI